MTIGMEACPGSNWLSRKAKAYGHLARIVPAQFVKPFVKSKKTDIVDAEAIAEAISRPTMRFVAPKTEAQLELDVSQKKTSICVIDHNGNKIRMVNVDMHPGVIANYLFSEGFDKSKAGLETGQLCVWLYHSLKNFGLDVDCIFQLVIRSR